MFSAKRPAVVSFLIVTLLVLGLGVAQGQESIFQVPESVFATEYGDFTFSLTMIVGEEPGSFGGFFWSGVDNVVGGFELLGDCTAEPMVPGSVHQFTVSGSLDSLFHGGAVESAAWDCSQGQQNASVTLISFETVEIEARSFVSLKALYRQ